MRPEMEQVRKRLEDKGYRLTPQRAIILETLLAEPERHLSADDLYLKLKESHPDLGIATIYRTLELFRELNIVYQMDFLDGISRYEYGDWEHHHHLVCLKCGKVIEFSYDQLEEVEKELAEKYNFEVIGHYLKLFGHCSECCGKEDKQ